MKTYTLDKSVTAHDVCAEFGVGRQTMRYWIKKHGIIHTKIECGKQTAITMIDVSELPRLRKLNKARVEARDHTSSPGEAA